MEFTKTEIVELLRKNKFRQETRFNRDTELCCLHDDKLSYDGEVFVLKPISAQICSMELVNTCHFAHKYDYMCRVTIPETYRLNFAENTFAGNWLVFEPSRRILDVYDVNDFSSLNKVIFNYKRNKIVDLDLGEFQLDYQLNEAIPTIAKMLVMEGDTNALRRLFGTFPLTDLCFYAIFDSSFLVAASNCRIAKLFKRHSIVKMLTELFISYYRPYTFVVGRIPAIILIYETFVKELIRIRLFKEAIYVIKKLMANRIFIGSLSGAFKQLGVLYKNDLLTIWMDLGYDRLHDDLSMLMHSNPDLTPHDNIATTMRLLRIVEIMFIHSNRLFLSHVRTVFSRNIVKTIVDYI